MRARLALLLSIIAAPASAQDQSPKASAPQEFVASFGAPGLTGMTREFVEQVPPLAEAPKPNFATLSYDRIGSSENSLNLVEHDKGITRIEQSLGSVAGKAERQFAVALGGLLFLARTDTAQVKELSDRATWVVRFESAKGSLFPLETGKTLTVKYILQEGWYFPGNRPNLAQRFGRWTVEESFEVGEPSDDCPGLQMKHGCKGYTIVTRCKSDGRMVQDGREIATPPLWFCQPRAERNYSTDLGWSWHPAIGNPRQVVNVTR
jgi:hypothetical protein